MQIDFIHFIPNLTEGQRDKMDIWRPSKILTLTEYRGIGMRGDQEREYEVFKEVKQVLRQGTDNLVF